LIVTSPMLENMGKRSLQKEVVSVGHRNKKFVVRFSSAGVSLTDLGVLGDILSWNDMSLCDLASLNAELSS